MFTSRVLLNKEYESNGFKIVFKHGLFHDYSVVIKHPHLTRDSDGCSIKHILTFNRAIAAREFVRTFINSTIEDQNAFFHSELDELPIPRRPGAPLGNQNAKKECTVKIQFRLDDPFIIEFLENYSSDLSIHEAAREILLNGLIFKSPKK